MPQRAATIAEVRARLGPAFTDPPITDDVIQSALDDAACFVNPAAFGQCASQAQSCAAAHLVAGSPAAATISIPAQFGRQESANANGPASRSYVVPTVGADDGAWLTSYWGRCFLEYRKRREGTGSAVLARTSRTGFRPRCH